VALKHRDLGTKKNAINGIIFRIYQLNMRDMSRCHAVMK